MNNTAKNILLLALIVFVGGTLLQPDTSLKTNTTNFSDSLTKCQNAMDGTITEDFTDTDPLLSNSTDSNSTEKQPTTLTSCNSFSPVVVTTNSFFLEPDEEDYSIGDYNALLSSQIFVFQEPDPPRLG